MSLRDLLEQPEGSALIGQIARQLGIDEQTARRGVAQLAPVVARGVQRNAGQMGGLGALLEALGASQGGTGQPPTGLNGNDVLGQIFGSKEVSRNVAGYAANQSGIDSSLLKQMLPLVAAALVAYLSRRAGQGGGVETPGSVETTTGGSQGQVPGAPGGSLAGMLGQMLDADRDGSVVDDLLDMARKYF